MIRFIPLSIIVALFAISSPWISSPVSASQADVTEATRAVVVPFSQIGLANRGVEMNDSWLTERLLNMRLTQGIDSRESVSSNSKSLVPTAALQTEAPRRTRAFSGLGASGQELADPNVAAGPNHVVAVVNRSVAIFNKSGQKLSEFTLRQFFGSLPDSGSVSIFYPKVLFDAYDGHFLIMFEAIRPVDKRSWLFLAVSQTNSAQGNWAFWELDISLNGKKKTGFFGDYPAIGLDQHAIYLTANMSNFNFRFQYAKIRVLKKSEVYQFGKVTARDFFNLKDATGKKAISIQPVQSFGTAASEFLVSNNPVAGKRITLWHITNPAQPNIRLTKRAVGVGAYQAPPDTAQKGGPVKIGTGDASFANAVFRDGFIYTVHTISAANQTSAIRFYQINSHGRVVQQITYGANGLSYFFPATMVDSHGNVVIVFNRAGRTQDVGILFTGRKATDPHNKLQKSAVLQRGLAFYNFTQRLTQMWGAYSGAALDADDSIWIIGAFAKKTDEWATTIGNVTF